MNEERPTFIDCANGQVAQTDCCVRRAGSLVEVLGHAMTLMTASDARKAGEAYIALADAIGHEKSPEIAVDEVSKRVMNRIAERSHKKQQKYGVSLERDDLSIVDWLRHAQEEALDEACYLERAIELLAKQGDDGK